MNWEAVHQHQLIEYKLQLMITYKCNFIFPQEEINYSYLLSDIQCI